MIVKNDELISIYDAVLLSPWGGIDFSAGGPDIEHQVEAAFEWAKDLQETIEKPMLEDGESPEDAEGYSFYKGVADCLEAMAKLEIGTDEWHTWYLRMFTNFAVHT